MRWLFLSFVVIRRMISDGFTPADENIFSCFPGVNVSEECLIIGENQISAPSDWEHWGGGGQRHHGARLEVKVNEGVCDGADAAGGRARSHLALLKTLEVALQGKTREKTHC